MPSTKGEFELLCDLHDEGVAIVAQVAILFKVVLLTRIRPALTVVPLAKLGVYSPVFAATLCCSWHIHTLNNRHRRLLLWPTSFSQSMKASRRQQSQNVVIPCRRSISTRAMCPSSGLVSPDGNGSPGTGVPGAGSSTDQLIHEMSAQCTGVTDQLHLSRNFADVQRQLSELSFAANTTADWMRQHDVRAFEIDKSLSRFLLAQTLVNLLCVLLRVCINSMVRFMLCFFFFSFLFGPVTVPQRGLCPFQ